MRRGDASPARSQRQTAQNDRHATDLRECRSAAKSPGANTTISTGIFKYPVTGRVQLRKLNLDGDKNVDLAVHGGPDRPVYVYPCRALMPIGNANLAATIFRGAASARISRPPGCWKPPFTSVISSGSARRCRRLATANAMLQTGHPLWRSVDAEALHGQRHVGILFDGSRAR